MSTAAEKMKTKTAKKEEKYEGKKRKTHQKKKGQTIEKNEKIVSHYKQTKKEAINK